MTRLMFLGPEEQLHPAGVVLPRQRLRVERRHPRVLLLPRAGVEGRPHLLENGFHDYRVTILIVLVWLTQISGVPLACWLLL